MKKYIYKLFVLCTIVFIGTSCENEAELTTLKTVTFSGPIEVNPSSVVINEENVNQDVITISWPAVVFPVDAPVTYAVQFDLPTDTIGDKAWQNAVKIDAGSNTLSKSLLGSDLNKIALKLGLKVATVADLVIRVEATLDRSVYSKAIGIKVTPYEKEIVYGEIYMPGSYQGWAVETAAALTAIGKGVYQGYVTFPVGAGLGFKLNPERNWAQFYGDAGNGNLGLKNDKDLEVAASGSYQMNVNLNTLKWSYVAYSWGIVGDATAGSWDTSTPMDYDHQTKTWKITVDLKAGNVKFRLNNAWTINYGPKNTTDGLVYLDDQGAHYVGEAGTYEITYQINDIDPSSNGYPSTAKYTITKK